MELKDYNLYSLFIRTVELKNYSRVAEAVGLSSHHIVSDKMKMLEQRVGVKLFVRAFRGVQPTSDALLLYNKLSKLLREIDVAVENVKCFDENTDSVVRMIIPETFASTFLASFLKGFNERYPRIKLESFNRTASENYDLFLLGKVDLVILIGLPVVGHRENLKSFGNETGIALNVFFELASLYPVYPLVKSGNFVGLYVKEYLTSDSEVVALEIDGVEMPVSKIVCGYRRGELTKAAQVFIDELVNFCKSES